MALAALIIIAALMYFYAFSFKKNKKNSRHITKNKAGLDSLVHCPVCKTPLFPGENLVTKVFTTPSKVNDQICYIYGCPHCFPKCSPGVKRVCPVCSKPVMQNQYLLARRFNKTKSGTPHVIVNGCGNCGKH